MKHEPQTIRILLVEDSPTDKLLLQAELADVRQSRVTIHHAQRLSDGIAQLAAGEFDVVLLDLNLPDSHGLATFAAVHAKAGRLPIIVLSGLDDEAVAIETVHAGAQDYLVKGSVSGELLVRAIRYAIQRKQIEEQLRQRNEQLQQDLNMASEFQRAFLPQRYPDFPGRDPAAPSALRFAHCYQPSGGVGGDYFEILRLSATRAGVFLCDVMGHGVRAALVTAMIRGLVEELKPLAEDPARFLGELNHALAEVLRQTDTTMFASAFYMVVDVATGALTHSSAGHPAPFLLERAAGRVTTLGGADARPGPVLGLFDSSVYPAARRAIGVNDLVLLYTDGVYEVGGAAADADQFGQERLLAAVRQRLATPPPALFTEVLDEIRAYAGGAGFEDDLCLVSVEIARLETSP